MSSVFSYPCVNTCVNGEEAKAYRYWNKWLWDKVVNIFVWDGPLFRGPDATLNSDYLEYTLHTKGCAAFAEDPDGRLRNLHGAFSGISVYGFPINAAFANPALGNFNREFGKDAIYIRNNIFSTSSASRIIKYAEELARLTTSIRVNLYNCRISKVFTAANDAQAQKIRKIVDDVTAGKPAVIIEPDLFESLIASDGKIPVYATPTEYLVDKYYQDIRTVLNNFISDYGINCNGANIIKNERNTNLEVNSNNQDILNNRRIWLKPREEAAKLASELFNTEITVKIREEDTNELSQFSDGSFSGVSEPEV